MTPMTRRTTADLRACSVDRSPRAGNHKAGWPILSHALRRRDKLCAALVLAWTLVPGAARAATTSVAAGGNLQQAIDNAQPGDTIALEAGATYTGNFVLPNKSGSDWITIRTAGATGLPGDGERVSPAHDPLLARIRSGNGSAAERTSRLHGVRTRAPATTRLASDLSMHSASTLAPLPVWAMPS